MTRDCRRILDLVVRTQEAFLDTAALSLSLGQAQRRFGVDAITCEAVLGLLVEANVLTKTRQGRYMRLYPGESSRAAA